MPYSETCLHLEDSTPPGYKYCLPHLSAGLSSFLCYPSRHFKYFPFPEQSFKFNFTIFYSGSAGPQWAIMGPVVVGAVVLAIVVGFVSWWVHKRMKCRRDLASKYQRFLASRQSHESWQQSCLRWPTYECVV